MPAFQAKLGERQARDLVAHIREAGGVEGKSAGGAPDYFARRFQELEKELHELRRQFRERSEAPAGTPPRLAPAAVRGAAVSGLFRRHCAKCHGADGTGRDARGLRGEIPDFTDVSWQGRRSDAQLLASILDGKGPEMSPFRGKISEAQARGLVGRVRAFAPATQSPGQEEPGQAGAAGPAEQAEPPGGFPGKVAGWLGKLHPPAVHFPIALLAAAAVAELLRLATGKPAFEAASRYCVWAGCLTAVAAALGWFRGGFRLGDASWVLTTHRWLGTATVACAAMVLLLSEASRRPHRPRTGGWFRVTLLLVAGLVLLTGFFGGAVVHGLDHYTRP
jgi:uncharacterized membrane protein/mono/diheme cytochrome c family protein